jgi:hypothetical protein
MGFVCCSSEEILLASMYIQPGDPDDRLSECISIFSRWIDSVSSQKVILIGDFNADMHNPVLQTSSHVTTERGSKDKTVNTQGRRLMEYLEDLELTILNGRVENDTQGEYTFTSFNGSSTIDLCLVNQICLEEVTSFQVDSYHLSSLNPISMQIGSKTTLHPTVSPKLIWKPKWMNLFATALCTKYSSTMTEFNTAIANAASQAKMCVNSRSQNHKPWYDKECMLKWKIARNALKESRKAGSPSPLVKQYYIHKSHYKALIRDKKESYFSVMRNNINSTTNPSQFWGAVRSLRRRAMKSNPIPEGKWITFYRSIQPTTTTPFLRPHGIHEEGVDSVITQEELEEALKKIKNKKAPGPDGIPGEFYQNLRAENKVCLLNVTMSEEIPTEWRASTTVMLHKKGDPGDPLNYRPISLLNISMKIFMQIITNRLTQYAEKNHILPEKQAGFRAGRGCEEQIFNLNSAIQIGTQRKKKVYALFIDFRRAFPSVSHARLWMKLYKIGVSAKVIRILQELYKGAFTKIRLQNN